MKTLLTILSLATLGGCAVAPPAPPSYGTRYPAPADPSQWHVVSVTPVAPGTGERLASSSGTGQPASGPSVQYSAPPITSTTPIYVPQPVYVAPPMYAPAPAPYYYYPPVSIGLDFMFGRSWGRHGHNWGGVGIGTRWPR